MSERARTCDRCGRPPAAMLRRLTVRRVLFRAADADGDLELDDQTTLRLCEDCYGWLASVLDRAGFRREGRG